MNDTPTPLPPTTSSPYLGFAAEIVSAFVSKNSIPASELPALIQSVHMSLGKLAAGPGPAPESKPPAVPLKRSVANEFIICLEDGKKFKSLKRHLSAEHGMTPKEYREKWGLQADYPMVAPAYAAS